MKKATEALQELMYTTEDLMPALRSAIKAAIPGRQNAKNTAATLHAAQQAFVRRVRARVRARG